MDALKNIIEINNGDAAPSTFPAAEYKRRLADLRAFMATSDISHALFSSYHNINYYGDFLFCHFGRFYGLVVDDQTQTSISAKH